MCTDEIWSGTLLYCTYLIFYNTHCTPQRFMRLNEDIVGLTQMNGILDGNNAAFNFKLADVQWQLSFSPFNWIQME